MKVIHFLATTFLLHFLAGCSSTYEPTNPSHDIIGLSIIEEHEPSQIQQLENLEKKNVLLLFEGDTSTTPTGGGFVSLKHPPAVKYLVPNPGEVLFISIHKELTKFTEKARCSFIGITPKSIQNSFNNDKETLIIKISLIQFESNVVGIKNKSTVGNYILSKATCQVQATEENGSVIFDELVTVNLKCRFGKPFFDYLANRILININQNLNS